MMQIIEIAALPNGAHRNQSWYEEIIPEGWALIPENMTIPETFPFVDFKTEVVTYYPKDEWEKETYTRTEVVGMTAGVMPEPEPEPEKQPTAQEDTDAMLVDHEYRLTLLELGLFE